MSEILGQQTILNTGNLLFDYNFNYNLRKYDLQNKNIKFMIPLDKIDFIGNQKFIDFINVILKYIGLDSQELYITVLIQSIKQYILIRIIFKNDENLKEFLESELYNLKKSLYYNFNIKNYSSFYNISIVIPIDRNT